MFNIVNKVNPLGITQKKLAINPAIQFHAFVKLSGSKVILGNNPNNVVTIVINIINKVPVIIKFD